MVDGQIGALVANHAVEEPRQEHVQTQHLIVVEMVVQVNQPEHATLSLVLIVEMEFLTQEKNAMMAITLMMMDVPMSVQ